MSYIAVNILFVVIAVAVMCMSEAFVFPKTIRSKSSLQMTGEKIQINNLIKKDQPIVVDTIATSDIQAGKCTVCR